MKPITTIFTALLLLAGSAAGAAPVPDTTGTLEPAAGRFLVARRSLHGPYFGRTVIYLIQHDTTGTLGVVVNRPLGMSAADVLPDMHVVELGAYPVYSGGPVNPHIMVMLIRGEYRTELAQHIRGDVYASSDSAMLTQLVQARKPVSELRLFAGQTGWAPGQLEQEIKADDWYVTEGDPDAVFSGDAVSLWEKMINRLDPLGIMVMQPAAPDGTAISGLPGSTPGCRPAPVRTAPSPRRCAS